MMYYDDLVERNSSTGPPPHSPPPPPLPPDPTPTLLPALPTARALRPPRTNGDHPGTTTTFTPHQPRPPPPSPLSGYNLVDNFRLLRGWVLYNFEYSV